MGERVRQREYLRRLGIRAVDEHQRGARIGEGKAAKLLWIEPPIAVVPDDAIDHHQDAKRIGVIDETAQRLVPGRDFLTLLEIEPERATHGSRGRGDVAFQARRADEGKRLIAPNPGEIAIPRL